MALYRSDSSVNRGFEVGEAFEPRCLLVADLLAMFKSFCQRVQIFGMSLEGGRTFQFRGPQIGGKTFTFRLVSGFLIRLPRHRLDQ